MDKVRKFMKIKIMILLLPLIFSTCNTNITQSIEYGNHIEWPAREKDGLKGNVESIEDTIFSYICGDSLSTLKVVRVDSKRYDTSGYVLLFRQWSPEEGLLMENEFAYGRNHKITYYSYQYSSVKTILKYRDDGKDSMRIVIRSPSDTIALDIYMYDGFARCTAIHHYMNHILKSYDLYSYNDDTLTIKSYSNNDSLLSYSVEIKDSLHHRTVNKYFSNSGNIKSSRIRCFNGNYDTISEYDSLGELDHKQINLYDKTGEIVDYQSMFCKSTYYTHHKYIWNSDYSICTTYVIDAIGTILMKIVRKYDKYRNMIEYQEYNNSGTLLNSSSVTKDSLGNKLNENLSSTKDGLIVDYIYSYLQYDSFKNWIDRKFKKVISDSTECFREKRTIKYYSSMDWL